MQRASDVASVMGIDMEMAMYSIAGAAKGNFTMMDNLGVAMNATTLKAYALEKGINFNWNLASNAEKAELAMQMFMEKTSKYAGNFARESAETLSGSWGRLSTAWKNWLTSLTTGDDVEEHLAALGESILIAVQNTGQALLNIGANLLKSLWVATKAAITEYFNLLVDYWSGIINGILDVLWAVFPKTMEWASGVMDSIVQGFNFAVGNVIAFFSGLAESIAAWVAEMWPKFVTWGSEFIQNLANGAMSALSVVDTVWSTILNGITEWASGAISWLLQAGSDFITSLASGIETLKNLPQDAFNAAMNLVNTVLQNVVEPIKRKGGEIIQNLASGVSSGISAVVGAFKSMWESISSFLSGLPEQLVTIGKNLIEGFKNGIIEKFNSVVESVQSVANGVIGGIKGALGIRSPSRKTREIGRFLMDGLALGVKDHASKAARAAAGASEQVLDEFARGASFNASSKLSVDASGGSFGSSRDPFKLASKQSQEASFARQLAAETVGALARAGLTVNVDRREFGRLVSSYTG